MRQVQFHVCICVCVDFPLALGAICFQMCVGSFVYMSYCVCLILV